MDSLPLEGPLLGASQRAVENASAASRPSMTRAKTQSVARLSDPRTMAQRYLFQLRDAVDSLDARVENWKDRGGAGFAESRDPGYWQITSLYAIGQALAAERILDLEGVYVQLESTVGRELERRQVEDAIRRAMRNKVFYPPPGPGRASWNEGGASASDCSPTASSDGDTPGTGMGA